MRRANPVVQGVLLALAVCVAFVGGWFAAQRVVSLSDVAGGEAEGYEFAAATLRVPDAETHEPVDGFVFANGDEAEEDGAERSGVSGQQEVVSGRWPVVSEEAASGEAAAPVVKQDAPEAAKPSEAAKSAPVVKPVTPAATKSAPVPVKPAAPVAPAPAKTPAPAAEKTKTPAPPVKSAAAKPAVAKSAVAKSAAAKPAPRAPLPSSVTLVTEPGTRVSLVLPGKTPARYLGTVGKDGRLPTRWTVRGAAGEVTLLFEHPDFMRLTRPVKVRDGESIETRVVLKPRDGVLTVVTQPVDAEIFVDGESRGKGNVVIGGVRAREKHIIEARMERVPTVRREVVLRPGEDLGVSLVLDAQAVSGDVLFVGAMRSLTNRPDIVLQIDGVPERATPQGLVRNVKPGQRVISLFAKGDIGGGPREIWKRVAEIEPGQAVTYGDSDAPEHLRPHSVFDRKPVAGAAAAGASAETVTSLAPAYAHVVLKLLDPRGNVCSRRAEVTFDDALLLPLMDGTWPVPVGRKGVLRVSVPGCQLEELPLAFSAAGRYEATRVLREKTLPDVQEWPVQVSEISPKDGVLTLIGAHPERLKPGTPLELVALSGAKTLRLKVDKTLGATLVCTVSHGQRSVPPPPRGTQATVRLAVAAK